LFFHSPPDSFGVREFSLPDRFSCDRLLCEPIACSSPLSSSLVARGAGFFPGVSFLSVQAVVPSRTHPDPPLLFLQKTSATRRSHSLVALHLCFPPSRCQQEAFSGGGFPLFSHSHWAWMVPFLCPVIEPFCFLSLTSWLLPTPSFVLTVFFPLKSVRPHFPSCVDGKFSPVLRRFLLFFLARATRPPILGLRDFFFLVARLFSGCFHRFRSPPDSFCFAVFSSPNA